MSGMIATDSTSGRGISQNGDTSPFWPAPLPPAPLLLASTPLNSLLLITALALFCLLQQAQRRTDLHRRTDVPVVLIVFSPLLLLPLLQLIPMPTALLAVLSPSTVDIRQLFATSHGEPTSGSWWPASMAPGDTAVAALMMIACLSAGLASFLSVRTYRDLRRPTQALVLSNLLVVSLVVRSARPVL